MKTKKKIPLLIESIIKLELRRKNNVVYAIRIWRQEKNNAPFFYTLPLALIIKNKWEENPLITQAELTEFIAKQKNVNAVEVSSPDENRTRVAYVRWP